ncbi:MAG: toll/interleukin-1 receptor domain-containing protein [Hyphomonadaceae bacterium]|nr:toll/interleukin-1 receptor domain-containing protein [Hyphomonadaceae bacterium]
MTEVALAFSNIDKPRADALARILNAVGYEVAAQPLTPEKVERASAVLAFWSPSSINSQPVQSAASQAAFSKKLVSVRAGPADPPAAFALVTLHDLSSWTGSLDAPELRTLVSHVAKMAPPPQQQPAQGRNIGFAGNGFDPYGLAAPAATAPAPQRAASSPSSSLATARREAERSADMAATPASARERAPRRERSTEEPRRAAGGGAARMAFGAIAVTVLGGGGVAAFNYLGGDDAKTADADSGASILTSAPSPAIEQPAPSMAAAEPVVDPAAAPATETAEPVEVASNTFTPPAPAAPAPAATVQSRNGWTAALPSAPIARTPTMTAQTVAATTGARPAPRPVRLPPIASTPQPTDIVAIDHANLGEEEKTAPNPPAQPERVWQRPGVTYGPDN